MFQRLDHDPYKKLFTLIDTDFIETAPDDKSGWEVLIEIYSKRNLNVWANFTLSFIKFCDECHCNSNDIQYMLKYLNENLGIKTDNLEKHLVLL